MENVEIRKVGISDRTLGILSDRAVELGDAEYAGEVSMLTVRWQNAPRNEEFGYTTTDVRKVPISDRTLRGFGEDALGLPAWHPARVEVILLMGRFHRAGQQQQHRPRLAA